MVVINFIILVVSSLITLIGWIHSIVCLLLSTIFLPFILLMYGVAKLVLPEGPYTTVSKLINDFAMVLGHASACLLYLSLISMFYPLGIFPDSWQAELVNYKPWCAKHLQTLWLYFSGT